MMKRLILLAFLILLPLNFRAQAPGITILSVKDSLYAPATYAYFIEKNKNLSLDNLPEEDFIPQPRKRRYSHHAVWLKFYIKPETEASLLGFLPPLTDFAELYVPAKSGYHKYTSGRLSKNMVRYDILESAAIYVPVQRVDFSEPFYLRLRNITAPEAVPIQPGAVMASDARMPLHYYILRTGTTRKYQIYLGIIALAALLFLLSYFITRDRNFLHYSLYLLALTAIFVHQIPFLHNFFIRLSPLLPGIISRLGIIATALAYFWFMVKLLETSRYAPALDRWIYGLFIFGFLYAVGKLLQMLFWPQFAYEHIMYMTFHIVFMTAGFIIITLLWLKPVPRIKKIIILGGYVLVAGHLFSMFSHSDFPFLNTVLIEIGLFFTLILLHYKRVHEERIRYKLHMLAEQQKRENLQALAEMKSKFFSHVSHEFRTPVTLIHASLNRLEKNPTNASRHIRNVRRHARRLLELVDQLLDLTKLQSRSLKPHIQKEDLHDTVHSLCESFIPVALEKNIRYERRLDIKHDDTYFDKDFIQKILTNLLSNAFKYTPEEGTVVCEARTEKDDFWFDIKNTGEGLNPEELSRIFDRFYQKDEHSAGAGLGLALVKELVREHGGEIMADSRPGSWTTFRVRIPVSKHFFYADNTFAPQETTTPTDRHPDAEQADDKPVLLIIEDHPEMREYLAEIFTDEFRVIQAADGKEGMKKAFEHIPDIIISDIMMPGANGFKVCQKLRDDYRTSHIPLILLTAKGAPDDKRKGTGCGAVDYIVKPFDESMLKAKVRNWMHILEQHRKRYKQEAILTAEDLAISYADHKFLENLEKILTQRLSDPHFGVQELAETLHMSRMQLHRKLKALTGLSASAFLRSQRLKTAAQLLQSGNLSVHEIAYAAGFNSPSYFTRLFKEIYGLTPAEYRDKNPS